MVRDICVVGLGYIGLPTASLLAGKGNKVLGVDISEDVVSTVNRGDIHIVEPGLADCVSEAVLAQRLVASLSPKTSDVFILAVPTPFLEGNIPNIEYVLAATRSIAGVVKAGDLVILESTCPVGTTEQVCEVLTNEGVDTSNVHIAYCPERVLPGNIIYELVVNDRIVGGLTPEASEKAADFYKEFVSGEVLITDSRTAEMTKLTENSFRDVNIAFANELSILCSNFEIDVWELIKLANRHPRVNILQPGTGVGGHCIAVDPWFIVHAGNEDARLIKKAREVNNRKTHWVIGRLIEEAESFKARYGREPVIACMGLAFKPNIDDLRESPAMDVLKKLTASGYNILAVEPNLQSHSEVYITDIEDAATRADIVAFLVGHREFVGLSVLGQEFDFCGVRQ